MFLLQEKFSNFLATVFSCPSESPVQGLESVCPQAHCLQKGNPSKGVWACYLLSESVPTDIPKVALQMFRKSDHCKD